MFFIYYTHVASIAAGNGNASGGNYEGVAPESSLIIVKLGERGRKSFARTTEIMRAVKYVMDKAIELNMPICINLSYGTNDGSHSGNSLFETYLNEVCRLHKCSIITASGNEGYSGHHFSAVIKNRSFEECEFVVSQENSSIFIGLWKSFNDELSYEIIAPNGERSQRFYPYRGSAEIVLQDTKIGIIFVQPSAYNIQEAVYFELERSSFIPSGLWRIVIYGENVIDGRINIWLPVTEKVTAQTKFLSPDVLTTLTIPSTAQEVISVGGYNSLTGAPGDFSGRGFTADKRVKPDLVAPAVNVMGASSGNSYTPMTGTSMAAPFVTGSAALLMQWGIINRNDLFLYGQRLKAFLQRGALRDDNEIYPNEILGWGKLCLRNTLKLLEIYNNNQSYTIMQTQVDPDNSAVYSEEYIDIILEYDSKVKKLIEENENIKICHIIENNFVIIHVKEYFIDYLYNELGINSLRLEPFLLGLMESTALDESGITTVQNQPYLSLRGNGVIIGIVDTGIDYRNPAFIYEDGSSKILSIWDQTIKSAPPEGFCYGSEYTNDDINNALNSENPLNIVPSTDEIGHGTNIASAAAGRRLDNGAFIGAAPDAQLVVVKLKQAKNNIRQEKFIPDSANCYESSDIMIGIDYIVKKAEEFNMPVSIIIGMGSNEGSHTGNSLFERYISSIAIRNGIYVSCAVGNEADKGHHASIQLAADNYEAELEIRVDENENGFPLYMWSYISDKISVSITSPLGEVIERVYPSLSFFREYNLVLGSTRVSISYFMPIYPTSDQLTLISFDKPTPGIWKIKVYGDIVILGDVQAWLPISDFIKEGTEFLTPDAASTATVPSTASIIGPVGAYNQRDGSIYVPSGRGPTRFNNVRPYYVAPGVRVEAYSKNSVNYFTGTSAAAAITGGAAALLLEWGIVRGNNTAMNSVTIVSYLIRGANRSIGSIEYPNNIWGYGVVDLYKSIQSI